METVEWREFLILVVKLLKSRPLWGEGGVSKTKNVSGQKESLNIITNPAFLKTFAQKPCM